MAPFPSPPWPPMIRPPPSWPTTCRPGCPTGCGRRGGGWGSGPAPGPGGRRRPPRRGPPGPSSLTEYYALTWQALYDAYARLGPEGILVITRWLGNPPSESARAWAPPLLALEKHGVAEPAPNLLGHPRMTP